MPTLLPLTGLTGSVTLPSGIDFKVDSFSIAENFRDKDAEGLADLGYGYPVQTGRSLTGKITGSMTENEAGIANPGYVFGNATFTFSFAAGQTISGTCCVSKFQAVVKVGEITTFECDFASVGVYTSTWPAS